MSCLFSREEFDLPGLLRGGADDDVIDVLPPFAGG